MKQFAAELPARFIEELHTTEASDSRVAMRLAFLSHFTQEPQFEQGDMPDDVEVNVASEASMPIPRVPHGPWRSSGGCFDYSHWQDRERFLKLDSAIASCVFGKPA